MARLVVLLLTVGGLACIASVNACSRRHGSAPMIRDSAGVRIVEYESFRGAAAAIHLSQQAYLDIGGVKARPEEELFPGAPYMSPVRLSDGRIVVSDMFRLAFFDDKGEYLGSAGRRGNGPGEFRQVGGVCRLDGDTLLAISENDRRVILWDPHGRHIRTFAMSGQVLRESCFPDGTMIMPDLQSGLPGGAYGKVEYLRIHPDGSVKQSLGRHPASRLGQAVNYVVGVFTAHGRLYVADPRKYEVQVFDTAGLLRLLIRDTEPLPPAYIPGMQPARGARAPVRVEATGIMKSPRGLTTPAYSRVLVDGRGRLWINRYPTPERKWPDQWTVLDSNGALLGQLELPIGTWPFPRIASVGEDFVVIHDVDADGAAHLRFHRFAITK